MGLGKRPAVLESDAYLRGRTSTGVLRRSNLWVVVAAFVFGLIGGVLLDRVVGGPGGLTLGLFVILIPGSLALVGPLAQEYWGQRFASETANRERFHAHAELLWNRVFAVLPSATLNYDVDGWPDQGRGRYSVVVSVEDGSRPPVEGLFQWTSARAHLLADGTMRPLLEEIEKRTIAGREQKRALDELYANEIGAALRTDLGFEFVAATTATGYSRNPPPAIWYPAVIVSRIRGNQSAQVKVESTSINYGTGEPPTQIQRLTINGQEALQVVLPLMIDGPKFSEAYNRLRGSPTLLAALESARSTAKADTGPVQDFAAAARDYAQAVEVSEKHLTGDCPGCSHLVPR
jgi:hypothetical protein